MTIIIANKENREMEKRWKTAYKNAGLPRKMEKIEAARKAVKAGTMKTTEYKALEAEVVELQRKVRLDLGNPRPDVKGQDQGDGEKGKGKGKGKGK